MTTRVENLRKKFKTAAGRKAFDQLNKLGQPNWTFSKEDNAVYLSPRIELAHNNDGFLQGITAGYAKTVDEAAINFLAELKSEAAQPDMVVVTNAYARNRSEFTYNPNTGKFKKIFP